MLPTLRFLPCSACFTHAMPISPRGRRIIVYLQPIPYPVVVSLPTVCPSYNEPRYSGPLPILDGPEASRFPTSNLPLRIPTGRSTVTINIPDHTWCKSFLIPVPIYFSLALPDPIHANLYSDPPAKASIHLSHQKFPCCSENLAITCSC